MPTHRNFLRTGVSVPALAATLLLLGGAPRALAQVVSLDVLNRLNHLELLVTDQTVAQINANTTGLATAQGDLRVAADGIAGNTAAIAGLSGDVTDLRAGLGAAASAGTRTAASLATAVGRVTALEAAAGDLDVRLGTGLADIRTNTADIASLRSDLTAGLASVGTGTPAGSLRLDAHDVLLADHATALAGNALAIGGNTAALATQGATLAAHDAAITATIGTTQDLRDDVDQHAAQLTDHAAILTAHDAKITANADLTAAHTGQIDGLRTDVDAQADLLAVHDDKITANADLTAAHTGQIGGLRTDVDAQADVLAVHDGKISANATLTATHTAEIVGLRGDVDDNTSDITDLQQATTQNAQHIAADGSMLIKHENQITRNAHVGAVNTAAIASLRVTSDEQAGHLARHDGQIARNSAAIEALQGEMSGRMESFRGELDKQERRIDKVTEGVAMALALKTPTIPDNKTFALTGGFGAFDGRQAFAVSGGVRAAEMIQIDGGLAVGLDSGTIGGRAGATITW